METPRLIRSRVRLKTHNQSGFSLIELLMTAFILAIGLLGLLSLQVIATAQSTNSRERGTATLLAHNILDRIVAEGALSAGERMDSSTGALTSSGFTFTDPAGLSAGASSGDKIFYFDISGKNVAATDPTKIFTITWVRNAGSLAGPFNASAEFIVNVRWQEAVKTNGTTSLQDKYFSVGRNVRL